MQFVLDCSVAISWCLVDENNPTANAILAIMPDAEAFVPGIWSLEIAITLLALAVILLIREARSLHFL
ncbi:hypothetical protein [Nostoc sp.]|uniref:hypothetical protein n=1 Tax=Nostoc sp. TaxID=1180 RepID=UPI002FF80611